MRVGSRVVGRYLPTQARPIVPVGEKWGSDIPCAAPRKDHLIVDSGHHRIRATRDEGTVATTTFELSSCGRHPRHRTVPCHRVRDLLLSGVQRRLRDQEEERRRRRRRRRPGTAIPNPTIESSPHDQNSSFALFSHPNCHRWRRRHRVRECER